MNYMPGKYTVELFAEKYNLSKQSAINKLSQLKKLGFVRVTGGGKQKRIYEINNTSKPKTNGFYDIINKYSPEKLRPRFEHYVNGKYTIENAIIDGIKIGDKRTLEAVIYLFRHVKDWKKLFYIAKKNNLKEQIIKLYNEAILKTRVKKIPARYLK